MRKLTAATMNMVLALGVICLLAGVLFFVRIAASMNASIENWTILMSVGGAIVFYLSLAYVKYALVFFTGLFNCLTGAFFMVITSDLTESGFTRLWPVSVVIAGVCILLTGIAKDRRIRIPYLCPSVLIIFLGLFFLLFSLDIIKMSFYEWISICWPLIPFLLGCFLIVLFLIQQNPDSHFPYDNGESEGPGEVKE